MLQFITNSDKPDELTASVEAVLNGGCRWIQLRMKDAAECDILAVGAEIRKLCDSEGATFILNDRPDLAKKLRADGVHLGKEDISPQEARKILGEQSIVGATANTLDDIRKAIDAGANYIGLGPFRFTKTKKKLSPTLGIEGLTSIMKELREFSEIPVVAIGGIEIEDIPTIMQTGVTGIAISGTILHSFSPQKTTETILDLIK